MKLSLLLETPEGQSSEAFAELCRAATEPQAVELELIEVLGVGDAPTPRFARQLAALAQATGDFVAVLDPHTSEPERWLPELLAAQAAQADPDVSAVISERKLHGAPRVRRFAHRVVCRLGGRRSPPPAAGTAVLFDRRWASALAALPSTPELELPLALGVVGAEWERVWHTRPPHPGAPAPAQQSLGASLSAGWRKLVLLGGLWELGLLTAVGLYGLFGVLIVLGSRSSWALKGGLGIGIGITLALSAALLQWLARRPLRAALRRGAETAEELASYRRAA